MRSKSPANGKHPCRNGQTGRGVSIGEMELEKGIIMLLGENLRGCRRTAKIVCGHEKLHLLSDSAHYIMPV